MVISEGMNPLDILSHREWLPKPYSDAFLEWYGHPLGLNA